MWYYGEYSEGEIDLLAKYLTPDSVVVEGGSNFGIGGTVMVLFPREFLSPWAITTKSVPALDGGFGMG